MQQSLMPASVQQRIIEEVFRHAGPEGNFLEAKAALYFGSGKFCFILPARTVQSAQFCKTALYFQSGTVFLKRKSFEIKRLASVHFHRQRDYSAGCTCCLPRPSVPVKFHAIFEIFPSCFCCHLVARRLF